jgi:hypothetical protein
MEVSNVRTVIKAITLNFLINEKTLAEISSFGNKERFHLKEDFLNVTLFEELSLPCYAVWKDKDTANIVDIYKDHATQIIERTLRENKEKLKHIYKIVIEITSNEHLSLILKNHGY